MATGNGEHILVVEDDAAVLRITCQRLRTIGYNTLEALSGEAALVTLGNSEKVDLVLSDINMAGGMSGLELARQIRALRPALPVLLTSGLPQSLQDEAASDQPTVLAKPYSLQQMADAIAKSLACAVPLTSL